MELKLDLVPQKVAPQVSKPAPQAAPKANETAKK